MNLTITNDMIINYMHNGVTYPLNNLIFRQNGVDNVVYTKPQPHDYSQDYFTVECIDQTKTTKVSFYVGSYIKSGGTCNIKYSLDNGVTWVTKNIGGKNTNYPSNADVYLSYGEKALYSINYSNSYPNSGSSMYRFGFRITNGLCKIYGNLKSVTKSDDFLTDTITNTGAVMSYFFSDSTAIADASNLIFPQGVRTYSYEYMFYGCTNLLNVPELPATTLEQACYQYMFYNCSSLTTAPVLPATTLAQACYQYMFYNCSSLLKSPFLPATTLTKECYKGMFYKCTSLNEITCLAKTKSATNCLTDWVSNVAATGTFYKKSDASWSAGTSGYPSGWTLKNYVS